MVISQHVDAGIGVGDRGTLSQLIVDVEDQIADDGVCPIPQAGRPAADPPSRTTPLRNTPPRRQPAPQLTERRGLTPLSGQAGADMSARADRFGATAAVYLCPSRGLRERPRPGRRT